MIRHNTYCLCFKPIKELEHKGLSKTTACSFFIGAVAELQTFDNSLFLVFENRTTLLNKLTNIPIKIPRLPT